MAEINALIQAGNASAGPPLGPQLGPMDVNIGEVVSTINEKTQEFEGMEIPVTVIVDEDTGEFEVDVGTPPTAAMIRDELDLDKLSSNPHKEKVANMFIEQCLKIALAKMPDLNARTKKGALKEIVGSCVTSGLLVEDKDPREVIKEIDEGKYDEEIENEKTELTEEERRELEEEKEELQEEIQEREEEAREEAEQILEEMEEEEEELEEGEEFTRSDKVDRLKSEDIPMEIIEELLPDEDEEGEETEEEQEG